MGTILRFPPVSESPGLSQALDVTMGSGSSSRNSKEQETAMALGEASTSYPVSNHKSWQILVTVNAGWVQRVIATVNGSVVGSW